MANYFSLQNYYNDVRNMLQDFIPPFRYPDMTIISSFNNALSEISRIRPDIFLDIKYQQPLGAKGPIDDGVPGVYTISGIISSTPAVSFPVNTSSPLVPIPQTFYVPIIWYMSAYCQFINVDDAQDIRAQSFSQKFIGSLIQLAA